VLLTTGGVTTTGDRSKIAVAERFWVMLSMQGAVPLQAPLQPVNVDPFVVAAVRVTLVPWLYADEQVAPQLIPAGELVTVPDPVPVFVTVRVCVVGWTALNVAVTLWAAFMVIWQLPVPEHPAPLQPAKVEPDAGVAVRVTTVLCGY
jgi:hypothetical protein